MAERKVKLVLSILSLGHDLLLSDSDTTWLRNPYTHFETYKEADILVSSDCLSTSADELNPT